MTFQLNITIYPFFFTAKFHWMVLFFICEILELKVVMYVLSTNNMSITFMSSGS